MATFSAAERAAVADIIAIGYDVVDQAVRAATPKPPKKRPRLDDDEAAAPQATRQCTTVRGGSRTRCVCMIPVDDPYKRCGTCRAKHRELQRQPKHRAKQRERARKPEYRAKQRELARKPKQKAKMRELQRQPKHRAKKRELQRKPKYKAKARERRACKGGCSGACFDNLWGRVKYDGRCVRCFIDKFPNDPRADRAKRYLKAKKLTVIAFLKEAFPEYHWSFDRAHIGTLCRPDAKTNLGKTRVIIVEVDENSHSTYLCGDERERERLFRLYAPRGATVYMIRFNPDAYDVKDPKTNKVLRRVPTCFTFSKIEAVVKVHPGRRTEWEFRLETLRKTIHEIADHQHVAVEVPACVKEDDDRYAHCIPIELFYDDVRAKYGLSGDQKKLAALKAAAKKKKRKADEVAADAGAESESGSESDGWSDSD